MMAYKLQSENACHNIMRIAIVYHGHVNAVLMAVGSTTITMRHYNH